ncbi:hypothetical protein NMG60_11021724 [Bertholletia excelsa]
MFCSEALSHLGPCLSGESTCTDYSKKKRGFGEAFRQDSTAQSLPLISWSNQPNQEDNGKELDKNSSTTSMDDGGDESEVVGWPPIKSWRKRRCHQNRMLAVDNVVDRGAHGNVINGGGSKSSSYVKVKMEGVGIARKVDLSLHHSYQTLTDTLLSMFTSNDQSLKAYTLAYQDREGDWLLAGDVPWSCFVESVQRLKLLRSRDLQRGANSSELPATFLLKL